MSASPAAGASGRSTSVAHFLAPHWGRIAERLAPVIDRDGGGADAAPAALLCVPDSGAAVELAAALRVARPTVPRILPVTDALRAARVLRTYGAPIVIATPADAERMLAASALPLDGLQVIGLVCAEEFNADQLAVVMASVPKDARRVLVASEATPMVEILLERYFHKAHRLADDTAAETTPAPVQYVCVRSLEASDAVPAILDDLDPPSATVVTADAPSVHTALGAHGYPADSPMVQVSDGAAPPNVALVLFAGLPSPAAFDAAMAAQPGRAVALIAPRQLSALRRLAGAGGVTPFTTRRATSAARAQEERLRKELRAVLSTAYPAREIVSLEPLLAEFDGAEIAGAALRLLDAARSATAGALGEARPAPQAPTVPERSARPSPQAERTATGESRPTRGPRSRDEFPLRDPHERARPRFVDRTVRRDRAEGPRGPRRDRDEGPRGPRRGADDGPRGGANSGVHGAKSRGSFGDRPRGGFAPKRPGFGDKPRGDAPRRPRGER